MTYLKKNQEIANMYMDIVIINFSRHCQFGDVN